MSPFEFFFSFYGLVLGLSVTVIATGLAAAIQQRGRVRIGWLTPLLAAFVGLDIASFWETAWNAFRDLPFSYGLLVIGLIIALVYFVAASLVFPQQITEGMSLDDHFWANKRSTLLLTIAANTLLVLTTAALVWGKPGMTPIVLNYAVTWAIYILLILPAAVSRRRAVVGALLGLPTAIYLLIAIVTISPKSAANPAARANPEAKP